MSDFRTDYFIALALVLGSMFLAGAVNRWRINHRKFWPDSNLVSMLIWITMWPMLFVAFWLMREGGAA